MRTRTRTRGKRNENKNKEWEQEQEWDQEWNKNTTDLLREHKTDSVNPFLSLSIIERNSKKSSPNLMQNCLFISLFFDFNFSSDWKITEY